MVDIDMKGMAEEGHIRLLIRADDTPDNVEVHMAFKSLAREQFKNDYTITLRELLKCYGEDWRFATLWEHIELLRAQVKGLEFELEQQKKPVVDEKKDKEGMF